MYILNVYQYLKPGTTEQFLEEVRKNEVCELAEKEPGCIKYEFYAPSWTADEEHVILVEKWENQAAQQEHLKLEALRRLQSFSDKYVVSGKLEAYTVED